MKKIKIVQVVGFILCVIYLLLLLLDLFVKILGDYRNVIISAVLAIIAVNLMNKGVLIKSSSTLWFSVTLILCAITFMIFDLLKIHTDYYFILSFIPIFASLLNLVIFHNLLYIKVIILNISLIIPLVLQKFVAITKPWLILLYAFTILTGIIICRTLNFGKEKV